MICYFVDNTIGKEIKFPNHICANRTRIKANETNCAAIPRINIIATFFTRVRISGLDATKIDPLA
jgi:hypothetical protein